MKGVLLLIALVSANYDGLQDVGTKYGHKIEIAQSVFTHEASGYSVKGETVTEGAMATYRPLWIAEWSRYPAGVMTKAKLAKVVFCEKLSLNDQVRAAVPAFDLNTMYFDPALGNYAPHYQRSVVHHEFFHLLDQRMGKLNNDPEWAALNRAGFKYGQGGKHMRTAGAGNLTTEIPGFLTAYGTSAMEEDKAEVFAHLIVSSKFVTDLAAKDSVMKAKIALMKKRMQAYDAGFNARFWPKP